MHYGTRRQFIALLGGGAAAWPLAARAQPERMRRVAMLQTLAADDREAQRRNVAFVQGLQQQGWSEGHNLQIDMRWAGGDAERIRRYAAELAALTPDAILAVGSATVTPLQQMTRTIPIVFVNVPDPVGAGFVESLSRPGGTTTGFTNFEYGISGKWLELLKEIRPGLTRAAIIRDAAITAGSDSGARSSRWRRRSAWISARSICAMPPRSNVRSRRSPALEVGA